MKGILTLGFTILGNKFGMDFKNYNEVRYWEANFAYLPADLQQALKSNDSRYTSSWQD